MEREREPLLRRRLGVKHNAASTLRSASTFTVNDRRSVSGIESRYLLVILGLLPRTFQSLTFRDYLPEPATLGFPFGCHLPWSSRRPEAALVKPSGLDKE